MSFKYGMNFFKPREALGKYYPELLPVLRETILKDDGNFDVLLLGASVLNQKISNIQDILSDELSNLGMKSIKIHNVSEFAQSSLDSYIKYNHLKDKHFDLIIFYHGINETRANNIPEKFFKENYNHCQFYENVNLYDCHPEIKWVIFPWILHDLYINIKHQLIHKHYIPYEEPYPFLLKYGKNVKTERSFKKNINGILQIAQKKKEPFLIMTFAFFIDPNYSRDLFETNRLSYKKDDRAIPIEMWGNPSDVKKGIQTHNRIIREIAKENEISFVDQEKLMPKSGKYFIDICHLSPEGQHKFVENILTVYPQKNTKDK